MPDEMDVNCRHQKLKCAVTYSSDRQKDEAIVSCIFCGFSVKITDKNLTDEMIRAEFNIVASKAAKGRRIFFSRN
ncbi:hypothetical protein LCGC14_1094760 [marine sediment metagenome]|uniref:Uncharacterized protein n=1 Tax=marine sediment metagenome TaxID=412755 RepID=A0A0F9QHA4_9ZZZZ